MNFDTSSKAPVLESQWQLFIVACSDSLSLDIICSRPDFTVHYAVFNKQHVMFLITVPQQKPAQVTQHDSLQDNNPEFENHTEPSCSNETLLNAEDNTPSTDPKGSSSSTVDKAILKLQERLMWAVNQLGVANSVEMDIKLCELISSCGNALGTLKALQQ
jgi:hypothetical protein